MTEIHDPNARRIVQLAGEPSGTIPVASPPTAEPRKPDGSLEDSLMAIQTVSGALIMPFLILAGLFGASMNTRD